MQTPLLRPPDVGHEPHNPVRDDTKLSPTEDLDRYPDGVPHDVVGLTLLFAFMLSVLILVMFVTGGVARIGAVALAIFAVPALVNALSKRAQRERDHAHPSR